MQGLVIPRVLTETKNGPDLHMPLLFIITAGFTEGSQHWNKGEQGSVGGTYHIPVFSFFRGKDD